MNGATNINSLVDALRQHAAERPGKPAFTFLADGEKQECQFRYEDLDVRARSIAAALQETVAPGERALLVYPPGLDFVAAFFGCLYSGILAVPAFPPNPGRAGRMLHRIKAIARDSQPQVILTAASTFDHIQESCATLTETATTRCVATDEMVGLENNWNDFNALPSATAFLQYTSGSTANPKGVVVSHGNLLHNQRMIAAGFGHDDQLVGVGWLPLYHDMGLIGTVLQVVYLGAHCVLMPPVQFLQRPYRWLKAISDYRATTSGGPNFAYELCANKVTPEQRETLDLSQWSVAFNGSEPICADVLDRFANGFQSCGFRREAFVPCYGLAEATLMVTSGRESRRTVDRTSLEQNRIAATTSGDDTRSLVSSGRTVLDQKVVIVDPATCCRCDDETIGEIWVAGPSVAQKYWNRPEESTQVFGAHLADSGDGPFLRTGDLGFLDGGELFVTGRIKDLIIIAGRNHYPQDIEETVQRCHAVIRVGGCAAFTTDDTTVERLVVISEIEPRFARSLVTDSKSNGATNKTKKEIESAVRRAVAENHDLQVFQVVLVKAGSIPKTSSGKTQRIACRDRFLSGEFDVACI